MSITDMPFGAFPSVYGGVGELGGLEGWVSWEDSPDGSGRGLEI